MKIVSRNQSHVVVSCYPIAADRLLSAWTIPAKAKDAKPVPVCRIVGVGNCERTVQIPVGLLCDETDSTARWVLEEAGIVIQRRAAMPVYRNVPPSTDWAPPLYDFQLDAIDAMLARGRGVVQAPPRSGKTMIGARFLEMLGRDTVARSYPGVSVLWLAPTMETVAQAETAIALIPEEVRRRGLSIRVACYAAFNAERDREYLEDVDVLVCDECHRVPADGALSIVDACVNAGIRVGLSATPEGRSDGRDLLLTAAIGPVVYKIERNVLEDSGRIVNARVVFHLANPENGEIIAKAIEEETDAEAPAAVNKAMWKVRRQGMTPEAVEIEERARVAYKHAKKLGIEQNAERNIRAAQIARQHIGKGDSVLILVSTKAQGKAMEFLLAADGRARFIFSGMPAKEGKRADLVEDFRAGRLRCLIATSLADEGIDLPAANVLILARGDKSDLKLTQRSARVLTASEGKAFGVIHDFFDTAHGMLENHSWKRFKQYQALGYEVSLAPEVSRFLDERKARRATEKATRKPTAEALQEGLFA